mgnify:CR=1 FL=1
MAKLTRVPAKVFGATASTTGDDPAIGQFGSAKIGTYLGTGDVSTIQSLSAWSNGWIDAVTPNLQFPTLPEMTGVHKVLSYQNAYVLQEGVAELDTSGNTYYYKGSLVKVINGTSVTIYKSIADNNNSTNVSDTSKWVVYFSEQQGIVGSIIYYTKSSAPSGYLICNGSNVSRTTYSALFSVIGTLYGSGDGSTTFTLPNLIERFIQGSTSVASYRSAGLPDHTHGYTQSIEHTYMQGSVPSISFVSAKQSSTGSASDTSGIYGRSSTVQPPALTLLPCIKY